MSLSRADLDRWVENGWIQGYKLPEGLSEEQESKLITEMFYMPPPVEESELNLWEAADPELALVPSDEEMYRIITTGTEEERINLSTSLRVLVSRIRSALKALDQ